MTNQVAHFKYRNSENTDGFYDRSGRFFCRKGSWFFKTREAIDYGPYQNRIECRYAYNEFIDVVADSEVLSGDTFDYQDIKSDWQPPKISFK